MSYEVSFLVRIYPEVINSPTGGVWIEYLDSCGVIQMFDCLLLIICIHRGFARKETVCGL